MKVRASVKKRSADCKIVRRKGVLYVAAKLANTKSVVKRTLKDYPQIDGKDTKKPTNSQYFVYELVG